MLAVRNFVSALARRATRRYEQLLFYFDRRPARHRLIMHVHAVGFLLWHTSAYLHIITMINMNCALWYINCRAIKDASRSLSRDFKEVKSVLRETRTQR